VLEVHRRSWLQLGLIEKHYLPILIGVSGPAGEILVNGASVIMSRGPEIFQHQPFEFGDWPAGLYRTPNIAGTRPGGAIAAAWAVLNYLGEAGYCRLTEKVLRFMHTLIAGITAIPELEVRGEPDMSLISYGSSTLDIHAVAEGMERRGWFVQLDRRPPSIHLMLSPGHELVIDRYLDDLAVTTRQVARGELVSAGKDARYS
jgi:glutamate/tyrosine decarboxylase-like PLP-dependent enzyme